MVDRVVGGHVMRLLPAYWSKCNNHHTMAGSKRRRRETGRGKPEEEGQVPFAAAANRISVLMEIQFEFGAHPVRGGRHRRHRRHRRHGRRHFRLLSVNQLSCLSLLYSHLFFYLSISLFLIEIDPILQDRSAIHRNPVKNS